jgi:hypothetical protein
MNRVLISLVPLPVPRYFLFTRFYCRESQSATIRNHVLHYVALICRGRVRWVRIMVVELDKCSDQKSRELAQSFDYHVDDFTDDEKGYLDQWLCRNIELEQKARPPKGKNESHMLDMLEGRVPIDKFGVEAYLKWKAAQKTYDHPPFGDGPDAPSSPAGSSGKALERYLAQSRYEATRDFLKDLRGRAGSLGKRVAEPSLWAAAALSTDFSRKFTEWTEWVSQAAPTVYDKSVDAVYRDMLH